MAIRTVRLDDEAEQALTEIRRATGLNTSDALKRGLEVLRRETRERRDLGPGGYAVAAAADSKRAVRRVIRRKHGR
jgi:hypothetical protein